MKKLLLIALMLLPMVANAEVYDKTSVDGETRFVASERVKLYTTWGGDTEFGLSTTEALKEEGLFTLDFVLAEGKIQIQKGRKLLIKFDDGSIMELENVQEVGLADYTYKVVGGGTMTLYYVRPSYLLTEAQVKEIINKTAVKLRIEFDSGQADRDIKKNGLSKNLAPMYESILKALSTKKTIYSDF